MTAAEDFWPAMSRGGHLVPLDRAECLELLAAMSVGRLGYVTEDGPRVVPINYALADGNVVFRTTAYGEIARYTVDKTVAFEVDDVDEFFRAGWSVLVTGMAEVLTEQEMHRLQLQHGPEPWAEGPRTLFLKVPSQLVSGRRIISPGA